jgi:hypothetical protein
LEHNLMKKLIALILILLLVPSLIALAQEDDPDDPAWVPGQPIYGLVSTDSSEVRSGPDFAYPSIGQLPLNASVDVLGRAGQFYNRWDGRQWIQIQYGDTRAWIYARLLRTSVRFNRIPVTGMILPRDGNGRVPEVFDLSTYVCDQWVGEFTRSGDFTAGDQAITVTFPALPGTSVYSVIVITPTEFRIAFDTTDAVPVTIPLDRLPAMAGTYTWRVVPYWTTSNQRYNWQQICPLRTGGTFDKPLTDSSVRNSY